MKHVQPERMQRFLAGEADLMERETVTEHLDHCEECAALLAALAADDDSLSQALRLSEAEAEWITGVDLTQPVMKKIRPWYREPVALVILAPMVLLAAYMLAQMSLLIGGQWTWEGPVGFTVDALREFVPAGLRLLIFIGQGGLLLPLLPVLGLAAVVWLVVARSMKKEDKANA